MRLKVWRRRNFRMNGTFWRASMRIGASWTVHRWKQPKAPHPQRITKAALKTQLQLVTRPDSQGGAGRMRQIYEERAAYPAEAAKVNALETELQKTKNYYIKRIRELEDKYKFGGNAGSQDAPEKAKPVPPKKKIEELSSK